MNNTEAIFFLHICRNTNYIKSTPPDIFKDKYVSALYSLTKDFYEKYQVLPFDNDYPQMDQILEVVNNQPHYAIINDEESKDDNIKMFIENSKTILGNNYSRYKKEYLDEAVKSWIDWEKFQLSYILASNYIKTSDVSPSNYKDVIVKAQQMMASFSLSNEEDEMPSDFYDPETHKGDDDVECFKSGWESFDYLCNDTGAGVKVGNLIILVGAPNVGKTIFLGNLAYQYSINGSNVLFISLEMDKRDMAHRMGANVFDISMDNYLSRVSDIDSIIDDYNEKTKKSTIPRGELLLKRMFGATDVEIDAEVLKIEREKGIKINIVVLDYFTEMGSSIGIKQDNAFGTYIHHKTNAKNLFNNAGLNKYTVITAHQSSEIDPDSETMDSSNLSESKGILHSPDGVIGIIQSQTMKQQRRYLLKGIKSRHSKYKGWVAEMSIDYQHMRIKSGELREENLAFGDDYQESDF